VSEAASLRASDIRWSHGRWIIKFKVNSTLSISQSSLDTTCEVQRVSRMDGVEPDRRAGAGASPWKSSRGTMPLTATRTAADALLSPCVPATR
jgi:hypothetical protein